MSEAPGQLGLGMSPREARLRQLSSGKCRSPGRLQPGLVPYGGLGPQGTEPQPGQCSRRRAERGATERKAGAPPSLSLGLLSSGTEKVVGPRVAGTLTQMPCALSKRDSWEHPSTLVGQPRVGVSCQPKPRARTGVFPLWTDGRVGLGFSKTQVTAGGDTVRSVPEWPRLTQAPWTRRRTSHFPGG